MPDIKGLNVSIRVDGESLPEYQRREEPDTLRQQPYETIRCIEATSNANFDIEFGYSDHNFLDRHGIGGVVFHVEIDGFSMGAEVLGDKAVATLKGRRDVTRTGQSVIEPFSFAKIRTIVTGKFLTALIPYEVRKSLSCDSKNVNSCTGTLSVRFDSKIWRPWQDSVKNIGNIIIRANHISDMFTNDDSPTAIGKPELLSDIRIPWTVLRDFKQTHQLK